MKRDDGLNGLEIPIGVSLTHDKGHPIIFAYVGGGRGRLGMRAKRFNPRVLGSIEKALRQAIRWRKQALREHTAAVAALPVLPRQRRVAAGSKRQAAKTTRGGVSNARGPQAAATVAKPMNAPVKKGAPAKMGVRGKVVPKVEAAPRAKTVARAKVAARVKTTASKKTVAGAKPYPGKTGKVSGSRAASRRMGK